MVKQIDITLETDWEEIVRNQIRELGFKDGWVYNSYSQSNISKRVPILQKTGRGWLAKTYKIGDVNGTKAEQTIAVFGQSFIPSMTNLAKWLEEKFDRPTVVILQSKTKKRLEGGFIKWIQDAFGT